MPDYLKDIRTLRWQMAWQMETTETSNGELFQELAEIVERLAIEVEALRRLPRIPLLPATTTEGKQSQ